MLNDPVALAERLMAVDSTSGREGPAIDLLERILGAGEWRTVRIPVTPGRDNLYAHAADRPGTITLSTHIDTVPPFVAPRRDERRLYGRGACDAKGIAAAMIVAAERLRLRGGAVGLLFVVGEEASHDGALADYEWALGIQPRS